MFHACFVSYQHIRVGGMKIGNQSVYVPGVIQRINFQLLFRLGGQIRIVFVSQQLQSVRGSGFQKHQKYSFICLAEISYGGADIGKTAYIAVHQKFCQGHGIIGTVNSRFVTVIKFLFFQIRIHQP